MSDPDTYIIDIITITDSNSDSNKEACSICLEPFNDDKSSYFEHDKHFFHIKCIQDYVKISKKSMPLICPVCNNKESTISKEVIFHDGISNSNTNSNCSYCDLYLAIFKVIYSLGIFGGLLYLGIILDRRNT
jgi:hypothetical protein